MHEWVQALHVSCSLASHRCTTPSIALNLFLSSCLHCVVCISWGHGAECIKTSALWHLSFAHSLKWNITGDVTDGSWGLTLLKLSDAGILSRAVTVQWDGEETSDHRVHSGSAGPIMHQCYNNSEIIVSHLQSLISSKQSRQGAGWVSHVDSVMFGRWASHHVTWHHVTRDTRHAKVEIDRVLIKHIDTPCGSQICGWPWLTHAGSVWLD